MGKSVRNRFLDNYCADRLYKNPSTKKVAKKAITKKPAAKKAAKKVAAKKPAAKKPVKKVAAKKKVKPTSKSRYTYSCEDMVVAAVGAHDDRKGATRNNIITYILANFPKARADMLKHQVKVGLATAQRKGLVAPHGGVKEEGKISLNSRWHLKGEAKKAAKAKK